MATSLGTRPGTSGKARRGTGQLARRPGCAGRELLVGRGGAEGYETGVRSHLAWRVAEPRPWLVILHIHIRIYSLSASSGRSYSLNIFEM